MTGKKVLVVDDEIHIVHVVAIKLRNNGYEVITAENGAEAFKIACEEKPDVIVTDFQMPAMTGLGNGGSCCGSVRIWPICR